MDWIQFTIFFLGNIVFTLTLWLWSRAESRSDTRMILELIGDIHKEMKDFHGRLERMDADFKNHLILHNDERNRK